MKLIILLNLLLALTLGWSWHQMNTSQQLLSSTQSKLERCESHLASINQSSNTSHGSGVAGESYDCVQDVSRILRSQSITAHKSISSRTYKSDDQSGVAFKRIDNPLKTAVTLQQLVGLVQAFHENSTCIQTNSLELQAPPVNTLPGQPETWEVLDFDLTYFSH